MELTQERLKELLSYDPLTGVFLWLKTTSNRVQIGDEAGTTTPQGYIVIKIDGVLYRAHRLAFLYVNGSWPTDEIDHIDLHRANNAWSNLRPATRSQNGMNCGLKKNNTSGFKGVAWHKGGAMCGKPWQATIRKDGKQMGLGIFETKEEAHTAYIAAAERLFGEYARAA